MTTYLVLPFFLPLFNGNHTGTNDFFLELNNRKGIEAIDKLISPPLFPISREMSSNNVSFHSFIPGETLESMHQIPSYAHHYFPILVKNCGYIVNRFGKKYYLLYL